MTQEHACAALQKSDLKSIICVDLLLVGLDNCIKVNTSETLRNFHVGNAYLCQACIRIQIRLVNRGTLCLFLPHILSPFPGIERQCHVSCHRMLAPVDQKPHKFFFPCNDNVSILCLVTVNIGCDFMWLPTHSLTF